MNNLDHEFTLPPFPAFPCVSRYAAIGPVAEAFGRVVRSIQAKEAISLVMGPPGTGKSLTCALVAQRFVETHDVVVLGETALVDPMAFQRALLHRMGVAMETHVPNDLRLLIEQRLTGPEANPSGLVMIVDEAESLSEEVLECIRRITNIMRDGQPVVSAMLAGGVKLDEILTNPRLESFVQRVTARCYLHPLNANETREYVRDCIENCGASPEDTVSDAAISAIHHATGGVARLVNQMMTEAIDCAAEMEETLIDEHTVDKAWAQLLQLPGPMVEEPQLASHASEVEFGELSELDCDSMGQDESQSMEKELESSVLNFAESFVPDEKTDPAMNVLDEKICESACMFPEVQSEQSSPEAECVASPSLDNENLFGHFDDEEEIPVGAPDVEDTARHSSNLALESMLHSEIISLSHFAAENTDSREDSNRSIENLETNTIAPSSEIEDASNGNDAPSVIWYDEPDFATGPEAVEDDTDLLWITEDIEIEPQASDSALVATRVDAPSDTEPPKLDVDYRELLAKMRNGS